MFSQLYLVAINRTEVGWQIVGRACSREAHWLKYCLMWTIVSASDKVVGCGGVACHVFYFIFIIVKKYIYILRGCNLVLLVEKNKAFKNLSLFYIITKSWIK